MISMFAIYGKKSGLEKFPPSKIVEEIFVDVRVESTSNFVVTSTSVVVSQRCKKKIRELIKCEELVNFLSITLSTNDVEKCLCPVN